MTRPSTGTDKKLLAAGRKLARKQGLTGLSIREVCDEAGVNLGMFHYHFKTREKFEQTLIQGIYAEFIKKLSIEIESGGDTRTRMKKALCALGRMIRDNRDIIAVLIKDIVNGNKEITSFIKENCTSHVRIIVGLINDCRKEGIIGKDMPMPNVIISLVAPVVMPCGVIGVIENIKMQGLFPSPFALIKHSLLSDEAIEQRAQAAIKGVLQ